MQYLYAAYFGSALIVALFILFVFDELADDMFKKNSKYGSDDRSALVILIIFFIFMPFVNMLIVLMLGECYVWNRKKYQDRFEERKRKARS